MLCQMLFWSFLNTPSKGKSWQLHWWNIQSCKSLWNTSKATISCVIWIFYLNTTFRSFLRPHRIALSTPLVAHTHCEANYTTCIGLLWYIVFYHDHIGLLCEGGISHLPFLWIIHVLFCLSYIKGASSKQAAEAGQVSSDEELASL